MKSLDEIRSKIKKDLNNPTGNLFIQMCGGNHPLSDFVVDCFKDEYRDKVIPLSKEAIIEKMQGYIDFALEKARNKRGISSNRSVWKYDQWLWALDDNDFYNVEYTDYGIDILNGIIKKYDLKTKAEEC